MLNRENRETAVVIFSIVSAMSHFNGSFTLCPYLNEGLGHSIYQKLTSSYILSVYTPKNIHKDDAVFMFSYITSHIHTEKCISMQIWPLTFILTGK